MHIKNFKILIVIFVFLFAVGCNQNKKVGTSSMLTSNNNTINSNLASNQANTNDGNANTSKNGNSSVNSGMLTNSTSKSTISNSPSSTQINSNIPNSPSSTQINSNIPKPIRFPQIVMGSTYTNWNNISDEKNYSQWDYVRTNIDGWLLHINRIGSEHPARMDNYSFNSIMEISKKNGIKLYVESKSYYFDEDKGTDIENIGYHDAVRDIRYLQRVYDAGHSVSAINFDGAFYDYTKIGLSKEKALKNLVDYYSTIHKKWPNIELYFLFNFPNWGWKGQPAYRTDVPGSSMFMGDAYEVYNLVVKGMKDAGVKLTGFGVDNPYEYAIGKKTLASWEKTGADIKNTDWMERIRELEDLAHNDKLKFSIIFNSQRGGEQGGSLFTTDTVDFINRYYSKGGKPDNCIIESWYKNPTEWLPETSNTTMAGCVKSSIETINKYK